MNAEELARINANQLVSETDTFTLERYKLFIKHIKKEGGVILDYGCNTGRGGEIMKERLKNIHLIGADIVDDRLMKVPSNVYDKLIDLNKSKLSEVISTVDVIVSGEVVEHIPFDQLIDILKELYAILNKGGELMLTTPNPDAFLVRLGRDAVLKDPSHVNIMDAAFLKTLLYKIGFSKIRTLGSGKLTRYVGENFPFLNLYGSYMLIAAK